MDVFLTFHQTYEPVLGSIFLSALVAGLPLRLDPGEPWIRAGARRGPRPAGEHGPGRVRLDRHPRRDPRPAGGSGPWPHRPDIDDHGPVRDGRTPAAAVLDHHPRLSHS